MGVSRAAAAENRSRVIEVASRLFREKGFDGIGVSDLMKAAGLTHGGFYANFTSKEDLAVKACILAFDQDLELLAQVASQAGSRPLETLVSFYLSQRHRDNPGRGCPMAGLAADAARYGPALRAVFAAGLERHVDLFETLVPGSSAQDRRATALTVVSSLTGALMLARSVDDPVASTAMLDATAKTILAWCGEAAWSQA